MSAKALVARGSALVTVPTRGELEKLSPADLWTLEDRVWEISSVCRQVNDDRLRRWIEVEGKTQTEVAQLIGRDQATVSRRCRQLGITVAKGKGTAGGRPTTEVMQTHNPPVEVVDAVVMVDAPADAAPHSDRREIEPFVRAMLDAWWPSDFQSRDGIEHRLEIEVGGAFGDRPEDVPQDLWGAAMPYVDAIYAVCDGIENLSAEQPGKRFDEALTLLSPTLATEGAEGQFFLHLINRLEEIETRARAVTTELLQKRKSK